MEKRVDAFRKKVMEYLVGDLLEEMGYELTCGHITKRPLKLRIYESTKKVTRKMLSAAGYLSRFTSKIASIGGRLNPIKKMQVVKKTFTDMTK